MFAPPLTASETLYVTDRVVADVWPTREQVGEPLRRLATGSTVEVLAREGGWIQVTTVDGARGWVAADQLQPERPAQSLLFSLLERQERATAELERLRAELSLLKKAEPSGKGGTPRSKLRLPFWGIAAGLLLALVVGFALGAAWLDYRIRERHGGFRV